MALSFWSLSIAKMQFILYSMSVLSNMALVYLLPHSIAASFLQVYSISAMLIGVFIIYAFSSQVLIEGVLRLRIFILSFLLVLGLISFLLQEISLLACVYSATLLLCDYLLSQGEDSRWINIYRAVLVGTVIPAAFGVENYIENMVSIRIFVCLGVALVSVRYCCSLKPLSVQSPIFYIVGTNFSYFGALAAIAWFSSAEALKAWYIGNQVGQGILLKMSDYQIRNQHGLLASGWSWLYFVAIMIGVALYTWYPSLLAIMFYLLGLLGLAITFRVSRPR